MPQFLSSNLCIAHINFCTRSAIFIKLVTLLDGKKAHAWSFCWIREIIRWVHGYLEGSFSSMTSCYIEVYTKSSRHNFDGLLVIRDSFEDELRAFDGGVDGFLPCVWDVEMSNFPQVAIFCLLSSTINILVQLCLLKTLIYQFVCPDWRTTL